MGEEGAVFGRVHVGSQPDVVPSARVYTGARCVVRVGMRRPGPALSFLSAASCSVWSDAPASFGAEFKWCMSRDLDLHSSLHVPSPVLGPEQRRACACAWTGRDACSVAVTARKLSCTTRSSVLGPSVIGSIAALADTAARYWRWRRASVSCIVWRPHLGDVVRHSSRGADQSVQIAGCGSPRGSCGVGSAAPTCCAFQSWRSCGTRLAAEMIDRLPISKHMEAFPCISLACRPGDLPVRACGLCLREALTSCR